MAADEGLVVHIDDRPLQLRQASSIPEDLPSLPIIFVDLQDRSSPPSPALSSPPLSSPPQQRANATLPYYEFAAERLAIASEASQGLNLTALLYEFTDIERALLDKLTVLQAQADRNGQWATQHNETKIELQSVGETITVIRYLMQQEDEYISQRIQLRQRQERLQKLQKTLGLLRKDNEEKALAYIRYNDAAVAATYKVVRAFAAVKEQLDAQYAEWEKQQRAAHAAYLGGLGSQVASVGTLIAREREALQEDYRIAGAAKRILDALDAPVVNPAIGAADPEMLELTGDALRKAIEKSRAGWTESRARDFAALSAYDEAIQRIREDIASKRMFIADTHKLLQAEKDRLTRMGLDLSSGTNGSAVSQMSAATDSMLRKLLQNQMSSLLQLIQGMLDTHHRQQLDAMARVAGGINGTANGTSPSDAMTAWGASPSELQGQLYAMESQRAKLENARKVLEDELARRKSRVTRAMWSGGSSGISKPPGAEALLAAVRAAGGVGSGASITELVYSNAVQRLLLSAGVGADAQLIHSTGLGTGGIHGLGGCEFCAAQRQIGRLADEVLKLQAELGSCVTRPSDYTPDCAPRLQFQIDKLSQEVRRRQALLAAEDVELSRVLTQLRNQLALCTNLSQTNSTCVPQEISAISSFIKLVKSEVDTRSRMGTQTLIRKQYACLWQFRNNSVAEVVAAILTEGDTNLDAAFATSLAFLEVQSRDEQEQPPTPTPPGADITSKRGKMLHVCGALEDPAFSMGKDLQRCLCSELTAVEALRKKAEEDAQTRADALAKASSAAAAASVQELAARQASEQAALQAAKDKLFEELRNRPEFAKLVQDTLQKAKAGA